MKMVRDLEKCVHNYIHIFLPTLESLSSVNLNSVNEDFQYYVFTVL